MSSTVCCSCRSDVLDTRDELASRMPCRCRANPLCITMACHNFLVNGTRSEFGLDYSLFYAKCSDVPIYIRGLPTKHYQYYCKCVTIPSHLYRSRLKVKVCFDFVKIFQVMQKRNKKCLKQNLLVFKRMLSHTE